MELGWHSFLCDVKVDIHQAPAQSRWDQAACEGKNCVVLALDPWVP